MRLLSFSKHGEHMHIKREKEKEGERGEGVKRREGENTTSNKQKAIINEKFQRTSLESKARKGVQF